MMSGYIAAFRIIGPAAVLLIAISATSGSVRESFIALAVVLVVGFVISRKWGYR